MKCIKYNIIIFGNYILCPYEVEILDTSLVLEQCIPDIEQKMYRPRVSDDDTYMCNTKCLYCRIGLCHNSCKPFCPTSFVAIDLSVTQYSGY